jgi:hypothetical protein
MMLHVLTVCTCNIAKLLMQVDTLEALLRLGPVGVTVDDGNGGQKPLDVFEIMRDRSWDRPPTPPPPEVTTSILYVITLLIVVS